MLSLTHVEIKNMTRNMAIIRMNVENAIDGIFISYNTTSENSIMRATDLAGSIVYFHLNSMYFFSKLNPRTTHV